MVEEDQGEHEASREEEGKVEEEEEEEESEERRERGGLRSVLRNKVIRVRARIAEV